MNQDPSEPTRGTFIRGTVAAAAVLSSVEFPYIKKAEAADEVIKVGQLQDRSGVFALFGIPKNHGAQLAIKEINEGYTLRGGPSGPGGHGVRAKTAANPPLLTVNTPDHNLKVLDSGGAEKDEGMGYEEETDILEHSGERGLLGRRVELISPDPQSNNGLFQQLARRMILQDKVSAIFGAFASAEREAIRPIMDQYKQIYFYANQYEGGVADKYTFCTGAVPEQQIIPVMEYMVQRYGPRIYILASNYNFGTLSAAWTKAFAPVLKAKVVGEEFVPLSVSNFATSISRIQSAKPDWLMMFITGQNNTNFYPQYRAQGKALPMGSSINMAQGYEQIRFAPPTMAGMHVAANYMQEIPTARNLAFAKRWHAMFPKEPYISQEGQTEYFSVHLWAKAVRLAGTTDQAKVIEALESGLGIETPEGWCFLQPATHACSHPIRLAAADEKQDIRFLAEWSSIEPWWLQRLGVNLVRHTETKQYTPSEDPFFNGFK